MRTDGDGEFWNYVIGGLIATVGAVSGVIAATGLTTVAQAGISAVVSGAGNFAEQAISSEINRKASKAIARQSIGKSRSALMRQSEKYISKAAKDTGKSRLQACRLQVWDVLFC